MQNYILIHVHAVRYQSVPVASFYQLVSITDCILFDHANEKLKYCRLTKACRAQFGNFQLGLSLVTSINERKINLCCVFSASVNSTL